MPDNFIVKSGKPLEPSLEAKELLSHLLELDPTNRYTCREALVSSWFSDFKPEDMIKKPTSDIHLDKLSSELKFMDKLTKVTPRPTLIKPKLSDTLKRNVKKRLERRSTLKMGDRFRVANERKDTSPNIAYS